MKRFIPCLVIIGIFASASFAGFDHTISSGYEYGVVLNNQSLLITGGGVYDIDAFFSSYIEVRGTAPLQEFTGGIALLMLQHFSTLNYYGGETGSLRLYDNAKATISGGQIGYIRSFQDVPMPNNVAYPHIEIICKTHDYNTSSKLLTGTWFDDSTFSIQLVNQAGYDPVIDNIRFIPEPATLLLVGVGGLLLRKRSNK